MRPHQGKCDLFPSSKTSQVVSISGTITTSSTAETTLLQVILQVSSLTQSLSLKII